MARKGDRRRSVAGRAARDDSGTRALLGHRLRLAQGGGETERPTAVHDRDRWARYSFHSRWFEARKCVAAHRHARMAGSIIEQLKIIDPLVNSTAHGASASDAFHLVIPSMPGYGFSAKPTSPGWGP